MNIMVWECERSDNENCRNGYNAKQIKTVMAAWK